MDTLARNTIHANRSRWEPSARVVVFFCHIMGVVFLASCSRLPRLAQALRELPGSFGMPCVALTVLATLFLPAAGLYAVSPLSHVGGAIEFSSLQDKASLLLAPFVNYDLTLDTVTATAVALFLATMLLTRRCRLDRRLRHRHRGISAAVCRRAGRSQGCTRISIYALLSCSPCCCSPASSHGACRGLHCRWRRWLHRFVRGAHGCAGHGLARQCHRHRRFACGHRPSRTRQRGIRRIRDAGRSAAILARRAALAPPVERSARGRSHAGPGDGRASRLLAIPVRQSSQQPIEKRPKYRALADDVGPLPDHLAFASRMQSIFAVSITCCCWTPVESRISRTLPPTGFLLTHSDFAALYRVRPQPRRCGGT